MLIVREHNSFRRQFGVANDPFWHGRICARTPARWVGRPSQRCSLSCSSQRPRNSPRLVKGPPAVALAMPQRPDSRTAPGRLSGCRTLKVLSRMGWSVCNHPRRVSPANALRPAPDVGRRPGVARFGTGLLLLGGLTAAVLAHAWPPFWLVAERCVLAGGDDPPGGYVRVWLRCGGPRRCPLAWRCCRTPPAAGRAELVGACRRRAGTRCLHRASR